MALIEYKLGELISLCTGGNEDLQFDGDSVKGISINKMFMPTKADLSGVSLANYTVVNPKCFSFVTVTSRNGNKISIAYNNSEESFIVSPFYVTFKLNDFGKTVLLEDYLHMFFNRSEFDRYVRRDSWGSAREYFYYSNICDVDFVLPDLTTQRKYVAVYNAMVANQQAYERGLEDLKLTCDALIDKVKHTATKKTIRKLLAEVDNRNDNGTATNVQGINIEKQFMPSVADITGVDLKKYKLVQNGQFAFSGMQTGRDKCVRIALYREEEPIVISPAYTVFETKDTTVSPEYIMIWFSRMETDRHGWFMSDSSIRTNLDLDRFYEIEIPVPDEKMQKAIVDIYTVYTLRRNTNEQLKKQIKDICPILIRGSLEDGGEPNGEPA